MKCLICNMCVESKKKSHKYKPKILIVVSESTMTERVLAYSQHSISCVLVHLKIFFRFCFFFFFATHIYNVMCSVLLYIGLCFLVVHFFFNCSLRFQFIHLFIRQTVRNWCACEHMCVCMCMYLILNSFILALNWMKNHQNYL